MARLFACALPEGDSVSDWVHTGGSRASGSFAGVKLRTTSGSRCPRIDVYRFRAIATLGFAFALERLLRSCAPDGEEVAAARLALGGTRADPAPGPERAAATSAHPRE